MSATSRELVWQALRFESPVRVPRQLWWLPWAAIHYPEELEALQRRHPSDIVAAPTVYRPSPKVEGRPHDVGRYVDEWGCAFENLQAGVIGEVKRPQLRSAAEWRTLNPPYDTLPSDDIAAARDIVNRFHDADERFVLAACCPRPWERIQFLLGSEAAMLAMMTEPEDFRGLLARIHEFYLRELEFWAGTEVDGLFFMDDWGSQRGLLIDPSCWREMFMPLYRDYCDLAHAHGKAALMHSDGNITAIYPGLIEAGVDALNSQLFTMDMAELAGMARGRITFWGEIDRQHVLAQPDPEVARRAVRRVAEHFFDPRGGVIAQFEFGPGANPANAFAIFDEWDRIGREASAEAAR